MTSTTVTGVPNSSADIFTKHEKLVTRRWFDANGSHVGEEKTVPLRPCKQTKTNALPGNSQEHLLHHKDNFYLNRIYGMIAVSITWYAYHANNSRKHVKMEKAHLILRQ